MIGFARTTRKLKSFNDSINQKETNLYGFALQITMKILCYIIHQSIFSIELPLKQ